MSRNYPRVESRSQIKPRMRQARCPVRGCQEPVMWRVTVQNSWFRSDDEEYKCCAVHCTIKSISPADDVDAFVLQFAPQQPPSEGTE